MMSKLSVDDNNDDRVYSNDVTAPKPSRRPPAAPAWTAALVFSGPRTLSPHSHLTSRLACCSCTDLLCSRAMHASLAWDQRG